MLASPLGRYLPGSSLIHTLDARVKLISFVALIFTTPAISTPAQLLWALAGLAGLVTLSRVGAKAVVTCLKPLAPFAAIVALFNLFVVQSGDCLLTLGPSAEPLFVITSGGLWAAVLYTLRLLIAVSLGALLLLTTTPTALTDAFEALLTPLARIGLPAHEIAMVLSLALRFVPILADETQSVIDAQAARGGSIEDGTLTERIHALGAVLVAVFAGAMRHAQNLSRALDARCYEGGTGRTHYREMRITRADIVYIAACLMWFILLAALPC